MPVQYGRVKGRFLSMQIDGIDEGDIPDIVALSGYVVIAPKVDELRVSDVTEPYTLLPQPFRIDLAADGTMKNNGAKLIAVIATDSPNLGIINWNYRADFYLRDAGGQPVNKASFEFKVPTNGEIDLTVVAPAQAGVGGAIITRGASAYEVAKENGFVGTVTEWLASLKGSGSGGSGTAGESAYQTAVRLGYVGTETQWIASLRGAQGPASTVPGPSAYAVAQAAGYGGTQTQWLASLQGTQGKSAYDGSRPRLRRDADPVDRQPQGCRRRCGQVRLPGRCRQRLHRDRGAVADLAQGCRRRQLLLAHPGLQLRG
jgi:hypothetical protein